MRPQISLSQLMQLITLLCVALGMTAAMGTTGTLIVAGLIYVGAPIYAFVTKRFRQAFGMYAVWNLLCALIAVVSLIIYLCSKWSPVSEDEFIAGFFFWTVFASGPIGLITALLIVEFDMREPLGVVASFSFYFGIIAMWAIIWRIFLMCHQKATPRGVKAEAINYSLFLLLVPAFAIFDYFAWLVLVTSY